MTEPTPIEGAAIYYVKARAKRNAAKARRNDHECEAQEEIEHDDEGRWINSGWAPCFVRGDGDRCPTCVRRDAAHQDYLSAAREMGAAWRVLKRRVEAHA